MWSWKDNSRLVGLQETDPTPYACADSHPKMFRIELLDCTGGIYHAIIRVCAAWAASKHGREFGPGARLRGKR